MPDDLVVHRERGRARGALVAERLEALVTLGQAATARRLAERDAALAEVRAYLASLPLEAPRAEVVRLAATLLGLEPEEAEELAAEAARRSSGQPARPVRVGEAA